MNRPQSDKTKIRFIRPLPVQVVNKIAAGEVIERPSAVVKELVENAIDAGATQIDIIIEKSGAKLIKIVDNGCGISEEQLEIAFSRHATSKISVFDDLNTLYTYGFRGEALPSIASVSRMRMVTRTAGDATGTEILYEGGVLQSKEPMASPVGTTVEVENLFFNTPARRKFLKSEATETRHISRTAMALAIGRYDIGFSYTNNSKKIFSVPAGTSLGERVANLLKKDGKFIPVEFKGDYVDLKGCIGLPDMAQHNRYGQFLFVNDRYVQSPVISHSFLAGYGELIPRGMFPIGALLLTVRTNDIDVNVHPGKTEVRLSFEREIHREIRHVVADSLRQDGIIPIFRGTTSPGPNHNTTQFSSNSNNNRISASSGQTSIPGITNSQPLSQHDLERLYNQPDIDPSKMQAPSVHVDQETGEVINVEDFENKIEGATTPSDGFNLVGRFANLYLLLQSGENLYIVDQHTAHERVLYEETLDKIEGQSLHGQNLLFPVQIELSPEQLAVFEESMEMLNRSGFAVSEFGGRTINIEAVPLVLAKKSPEKMFIKIIDDISSLRKAGCDLIKAMAQSIACRSAVMSGDRLTDQEATHLIKSLLNCREKYSCPHGRPTFIKISKDDLDKQFGRG